MAKAQTQLDPREKLREKLANLERLKREAKRITGTGSRDAAQAHRDRMAQKSREHTSILAEIGPIKPVKDPARRESCRTDLLKFLTTYFPETTGLHPLSPGHERAIRRIQGAILEGGRYAQAVFRGWAKTTISENAAIWAGLYGHRKFVVIIGADKGAADDNIRSIKTELETNDLLQEDFPEVCTPIEALEGKVQRCASQTFDGELTHIRWTSDTLVLPRIKGSAASGVIIAARGITGRVRGMKHKRPDGAQARPDFVIIDDPQTDESADSPSQIDKRLEIIRRAVLKLAGHNKTIACVLNGTVICRDDVVDQLCNFKLNPAWQSERIKMVEKWAKAHEKLWLGKYKQIREAYDPDVPEDQKRAHDEATEFYRKNRKKMDEGCIVAWDHCYDHELEISAIQHAYNALIDDGEATFASEYQNEPLEDQAQAARLKPEQVMVRGNGRERGHAPVAATTLTAYIDVQGSLLYYVVAAWEAGFSGSIMDYGTFPEQKQSHFTLAKAKQTLAREYPGMGREAAVQAALQKLIGRLMNHAWPIAGGSGAVRIDRLLIDSGYLPGVVAAACSAVGGGVMPAKGVGIKAANRPMSTYKRKPGERHGHHWYIPNVSRTSEFRHILIDTNFWKSHVHAKLLAAPGDPGAITLFGRKPQEHRMIAEHIAASETWTETEGHGRTLQEWALKPGRPDNHLFDCLVGAAVAASMEGVSLPGMSPAAGAGATKRKKYKQSDFRR